MTMFDVKGYELARLTLSSLLHRRVFMEKKSCCLYSKDYHGIKYFEFLTRRYSMQTQFQQQQRVHENLRKIALHWSIEEILCLSPIRQGHIDLGVFFFLPNHHILQTLHQMIIIFLVLYKMRSMIKVFLINIWLKLLMKNYWARNQLKFSWLVGCFVFTAYQPTFESLTAELSHFVQNFKKIYFDICIVCFLLFTLLNVDTDLFQTI